MLPILSPRSAGTGCRCPGSEGYTSVAATTLGISHQAKNCFSNCASELRQGGGHRRGDLTGEIGLVALIPTCISCLFSRSLGITFPSSDRSCISRPYLLAP